MIGRRLILIVLRSFISGPMPHLLVMILFCVMFLLHHALTQPFRDSIANTTEMVSLTSAVILAVVNMFFASFVSLTVPLNDHFSSWYNPYQVVDWSSFCVLFPPCLVFLWWLLFYRRCVGYQLWFVLCCITCIRFVSVGVTEKMADEMRLVLTWGKY